MNTEANAQSHGPFTAPYIRHIQNQIDQNRAKLATFDTSLAATPNSGSLGLDSQFDQLAALGAKDKTSIRLGYVRGLQNGAYMSLTIADQLVDQATRSFISGTMTASRMSDGEDQAQTVVQLSNVLSNVVAVSIVMAYTLSASTIRMMVGPDGIEYSEYVSRVDSLRERDEALLELVSGLIESAAQQAKIADRETFRANGDAPANSNNTTTGSVH